jgi:hypothetical protein
MEQLELAIFNIDGTCKITYDIYNKNGYMFDVIDFLYLVSNNRENITDKYVEDLLIKFENNQPTNYQFYSYKTIYNNKVNIKKGMSLIELNQLLLLIQDDMLNFKFRKIKHIKSTDKPINSNENIRTNKYINEINDLKSIIKQNNFDFEKNSNIIQNLLENNSKLTEENTKLKNIINILFYI